MAFTMIGGGARPPLSAASQINPGWPIALVAGSPGEAALPAATVQLEPFGICMATVASGGAVQYWVIGDVGKAFAAASMGAGAHVGVAATTGLQLTPLVTAAGASAGLLRYSVGRVLKQAAAGDAISVYINPTLIL